MLWDIVISTSGIFVSIDFSEHRIHISECANNISSQINIVATKIPLMEVMYKSYPHFGVSLSELLLESDVFELSVFEFSSATIVSSVTMFKLFDKLRQYFIEFLSVPNYVPMSLCIIIIHHPFS